MQITTTKCGQFQHPEFVLEADEAQVPDTYLKDVARTVEEMVAGGSVFQPDQTFQIGWGITLVRPFGPSQLTLAEPDMESLPIQWIPGITSTLRQMMLQLFMLDSVAMRHEMELPSLQQSVLVCNRYHEPSFFMDRMEKSDGPVSGWFVGCINQEHDHNNPANLKCISVYEALLHQKGIQGFAAFPVGSLIIVDQKKGLKIVKDDEERPIQPGSFLDEWFKKQATERQ